MLTIKSIAISDVLMAIFKQQSSNNMCSFYVDLKPDYSRHDEDCKTGLRLN